MTEVQQANTEQATSLSERAKDLFDRYTKRGKIIVDTNNDEETTAFVSIVDMLTKDETESVVDWTEKVGKDQGFTNFALVRNENDGSNRVIAVANAETALADDVVKRNLYRLYTNRVLNAAGEDDASEAQFVIPSGCFKARYDLDAFKFQAKALAKALHKQGVNGVTVASLRMAFANSAFAATQFARVKPDMWQKIIGVAKARAQQAGYDVAIFDYWLSTRDAKTDEIGEIDLNLEEFSTDVSDEGSEEKTAEQPAA